MSTDLIPLHFPLRGSRLIEASAGTGKTWTIAALYVRLVLGHGGDDCRFVRPLQPAEILVMTFTRAATRELSDRIRERLVDAAQCFRGKAPDAGDHFLRELIACYGGDEAALQQAAHRLMSGAEAMDESAVFTIDAWCQRMLREHAFDSGALFDEELIDSERALFNHAIRDYWRNHVYALSAEQFDLIHAHWTGLDKLEKDVRDIVQRTHLLDNQPPGDTLAQVLAHVQQQLSAALATIKSGWAERAAALQDWFARNRAAVNGNRYRAATVDNFFRALSEWANNPALARPGEGFYSNDAWDKWSTAKLIDARTGKNQYDTPPPSDFELIASLKQALESLPQIPHFVLPHAAIAIARRMQDLKSAARKFGFADMLTRLKIALEGENGAALRERILTRYPVALIDEFQDTSPDQYRIFDQLYDVAGGSENTGLFLIGDPKQAIYGFRGADIHSYLAARRATQGRHYRLATNYRSTDAVVRAINQLFGHAEGQGGSAGHAKGAFGFRNGEDNPLPFEQVRAHDRKDRLMRGDAEIGAMTVWVAADHGKTSAPAVQQHFAAVCAEQIVTLLNDETVRFESPKEVRRLQPADIAVLVKDRHEAARIQQALRERNVPSVYLSDKDSVLKSDEAPDVLRWLQAVSNPLDGALARCAFATRTAGLSIAELVSFIEDDVAWEARVEQLKQLKQVWQRHGVLAMLRRFIHELRLPETLFTQPGGERSLTNLLHLAELLQEESLRLEGEQALIRWLAEQIESSLEGGEEHILRLESEAQLVKVVTIHKSKGLEYPLVFLPFAAACRPVTRKNRSHFEYTYPGDGRRRIDFALSDDGLQAMEAARIEEDLRLLYVALTRARHALWLGVTSGDEKIHLSALGYLVNGGTGISAAELKASIGSMCAACAHIAIIDAPGIDSVTLLSRSEQQPPLRPVMQYDGDFERDWTVTSYSAITRHLASTRVAATRAEQKVMEEGGDAVASGPVQEAPWHRFPRGMVPGLLLHGLLEWMVEQGLDNAGDTTYQQQLAERCVRAGWESHQDAVVSWLTRVVQTSLPAIDTRLCDVRHVQAETEFWIPAEKLPTAALDRLCRENLLPDLPRPGMSARQVTGMLRGFIDLVFEHDGRYWILDYKSTALGNHDSAYHQTALEAAVVAKRYEVQGMIYLLALHRMLKTRLGDDYRPQQQLGGAVFFFLRGIGNAATHGCCHICPDPTLLDELDRLFPAPQLEYSL
jgi:exodeoxyribonuclease V beta subunit